VNPFTSSGSFRAALSEEAQCLVRKKIAGPHPEEPRTIRATSCSPVAPSGKTGA
jgi:hypothetical protein